MIRIYIANNRFNRFIKLTSDELHYLKNVMRKRDGSEVLVFNELDGEWIGSLNQEEIILKTLNRPAEVYHTLCIGAGCIKRIEYLVEKVIEVGATDIYLLNTDRSQRIKYQMGRLNKIAMEAVEQCGRMDRPVLHEPMDLQDFLKLDLNFCLADCNAEKNRSEIAATRPNCYLIGPEGGWSDRELQWMQALPKISLSKNILRAETAAVVALAHHFAQNT